jgi:hypothetical protein
MSRRTVAIEGRPTTDGRLIEHGALRWGGDPVAVYAHVPGSNGGFPVLLGKAEHFRREDNGEITAEIEIARAMGENEFLAVSLLGMDAANVDGMLRIRRARIYDLMLTNGWAWPDV